jgi:osmotically-inducible protein OsmY
VKSDAEIREDVTGELHWDPQVPDPEAIGVAVKDGAVTLTGAVPTYAEGLAAVRAASRAHGAKAVADELRVRLAGEPRDDSGIARAIAHVLEWNTQIPEGRAQARVQAGWVVLDGGVGHEYQRHEVERMVQHIRGVRGVTNNIAVASPASPDRVVTEIEEAFRCAAEVDARHVRVEMSDHTAELYGHVHSLSEAAAAPGVGRVESHLVVSP